MLKKNATYIEDSIESYLNDVAKPHYNKGGSIAEHWNIKLNKWEKKTTVIHHICLTQGGPVCWRAWYPYPYSCVEHSKNKVSSLLKILYNGCQCWLRDQDGRYPLFVYKSLKKKHASLPPHLTATQTVVDHLTVWVCVHVHVCACVCYFLFPSVWAF